MLDPQSTSVQQWLFRPEHLSSTPSIKDGFTPARELEYRRRGVLLISSLIARLSEFDPTKKLGDAQMTDHYRAVRREFTTLTSAKDVVTTASVFFHRFYMRHSLRAFKYEDIAPTCLYLALKVEERGTVKIHHVARATKMKVDVHGDHDEAYYTAQIAQDEESLLEALCFDLILEQPLGYVLLGMRTLCRSQPIMRYVSSTAAGESTSGKPKDGASNAGTPNSSVGGASPIVRPYNRTGGREGPFPLGVESKSQVGGPQGGRTPYGGKTPTPRNGSDLHDPEERSDRAVLEMAYAICYETTSSPLCLLVLPCYIAAASVVLALSVLGRRHREDVLHSVDEGWMDAFKGALQLSGQKGLQEFRKELRATVELILKFGSERCLMTDGFAKRLLIDAEPTSEPVSEPPGTDSANPTNDGEAGAASLVVDQAQRPDKSPVPALHRNDTQTNGVGGMSPPSRLLAVPGVGKTNRPKTADNLREDIASTSSDIRGVPITKQVGRDVADVTSELLVANARQGIGVDELGMGAELTSEDVEMST